MDYLNKLDIFNLNISNIKSIIKKKIKNNLIIRGSGGSNNIVIVNLNYDIPFVIKIIPIIKEYNDIIQPNNNLIEIENYKILTNEFVKITPHIVFMYNKYTINDINIILPEKCLSLDEKINLNQHSINSDVEHLCLLKSYNDKKILDNKLNIIILEYCYTNISDYIENFLKNYNKIEFINIINRIIFQVIYTLAVIQDKYPNFIHNDLFLRNIMAITETKYNNNDYIEYKFNNIKYYFPANGIYIKINDFNFTLGLVKTKETLINDIKYNTDYIYSRFEINNPVRDIYTFLFDLYDGSNFGSKSVKQLLKDNLNDKSLRKNIIKIFKKEIKKYFDYKTIDKLKKINNDIDDIWNISESKILKNTVRKPTEYFNNNIFKSYTVLPPGSKIIKSFN
jgi:hypothetical protein